MSLIVPAQTKPEDEELAKKRLELAQLESELADRELFLATLRSELAAFERLYLKIVGARYAELDDLEAHIAEQLARQREGDQQVQNVAKRAREQANQSRSTVEAQTPEERTRTLPSQELKSLYRDVAKRVHPDLSSNPEDRIIRERFMAEANRAYEMGDLARLRRILEEYESRPEGVPGEGTAAELVRVIRKITQVRRRLSEIEIETQHLSASELAKLKAKADEYERLGRDLLAEMAEHVDRQIASAREKIS